MGVESAWGIRGTCDLATNLHGVDSSCTWAEALGVWIAAINAARLGGHSDWRIPNVKELQSIVDYGKFLPASSIPGLTSAEVNYWSSTPLADSSVSAWSVYFNVGTVFRESKLISLSVRAVRGAQ